MVGHVDDRLLRGCCLISNVDGVVVRQRVGDGCRDRSGEIVVAIGREDGHLQGRVVKLSSVIHLILPTRRSAVQTVAIVVLRQLYGLAVNRYLSFVYAVGITSDGGTEVAAKVYAVSILRNVVVTQHHIAHHALAVGHHYRDDARTEVGYAHLHALAVAHGVEVRLAALDIALKMGGVKTRERQALHAFNHGSGCHSRGR